MPEDNNSRNWQEVSVLQILKEIHEGITKGNEVPTDKRQECVEYLWLTRGYTVVEMAKALDVSDRTIKRDKGDIRKRNAQKPSAEYALEKIGEMIQIIDSALGHLVQLSHSSEATVQEKVQAAYDVCGVVQNYAKFLQSLGYLPQKPMQIEADIYHHQEEESSAQLKEKLAKLKKLAGEGDKIDPEVLKHIETAEKQIALAEASSTIAELEKKLGESDKGKETQDEQSR